jgi:putative MFS transporter
MSGTSSPSARPSSTTTDALRRQARHELTAALDRVPFRRVHVWILVLVAGGALFDAIEQYNVGLAAPSIAKLWHLDGTQTGLLTTLTFAGMAVGSLIAGVTGDKFGRRFTYMYNLLIFTLGAPCPPSHPTSASCSPPGSSWASASAAS